MYVCMHCIHLRHTALKIEMHAIYLFTYVHCISLNVYVSEIPGNFAKINISPSLRLLSHQANWVSPPRKYVRHREVNVYTNTPA